MTDTPQPGECTLEDGIKRGDTTIKKLILRKPEAGELRGLNLNDLLNADISAIITVLPRISDPIITRQEAEKLSLPDLVEVGGTITSFLYTLEQKQMIENMKASMA